MEDNKQKSNNFITTFKFAWHYWSGYRYAIVFLLVLLGLQTILQVFIPILTGKLVNSFTNSTDNWIIPAWICGTLASIKLLSYILRISTIYLWSNATMKVTSKLVAETFNRVQHLSTEWHINNFAGSIIRNINRGTWGFDKFIDTLSMSIYPSILTSIGLICILFRNGVWIGIIGFLGFIIFFL